MTVKEFRNEILEKLSKYDDNMEIIFDQHSDYITPEEIDTEIIFGVNQGSWIMRSHPTMSDENKSKEKEYVYIGWS